MVRWGCGERPCSGTTAQSCLLRTPLGTYRSGVGQSEGGHLSPGVSLGLVSSDLVGA